MAQDIMQMLQMMLGGGAQLGAPSTSPKPSPGAGEESAEGDSGPDTSDEEMLEQVHRGMGTPENSVLKWQNVDDDREALLKAPTDQNINDFVNYWGENELPEEMQNPDKEAPDYARPGD